MANATTGLVVARRAVIVAGMVALASGAAAVDFLDGRIQIHGFGEVQVRALDEKFKEELDLAQWYNVLNVEFEFDLAPDGFGPFDLASAYARVEARYDAIYSQGFGMFPSVNTFGDDAERLPLRLRDAIDKEFGGTNRATDRFGDFAHLRIENQAPSPLPPLGERLGFPGYDTFFRQFGPDDIGGPSTVVNRGRVGVLNSVDDPGWYVHEKIIDYKFAFKDFRGTANTGTQILGPWLPKNFVRSIALNQDRGNALRGRIAPAKPRLASFAGVPDPDGGPPIIGFGNFRNDPAAIRYFEGDPTFPVVDDPATPEVEGLDDPNTPAVEGPATGVVDRLDPLLSAILNAPPTVWAGRIDLDGNFVPNNTLPPAQQMMGLFRAQTLASTFPSPANRSLGSVLFGGDFLGGTAACTNPSGTLADVIRDGSSNPDPDCIRGSVDVDPEGAVDTSNPAFLMDRSLIDPDDPIVTDNNVLGITKIVGGIGENPFRPAPDASNLGRIRVARDGAGGLAQVGDVDSLQDIQTARGLHMPSQGTLRALRSGRLDKPNVNFREQERAWNRGDSQNRTKELKEAYLDLELLDSRLWLRLGLQNIVWGKTELFRTTDQFNPQDLALASLPSLEESRIALWSARAVYSLYNVGPLEDVRIEFAANLDHYQNADIGACGEPFTPDLVCGLTTGLFAHGLLGIGVVGIDRPESPWKELSDLEIGGRLEWRWDRFSFALTDFYGFSDFPFAEAVFFYERAVDPGTGRPLVARLPGQSLGTCARAGQVSSVLIPQTYGRGTAVPAWNTAYASHPLSVTTGLVNQSPGAQAQFNSATRGGIGTDPNCLRPGGPPGAQNAFDLAGLVDGNGDPLAYADGIVDDIANTNALEHHPANQQIFSWICALTVGIAPTLDASACAWTIFSTPEVLLPGLLDTPFSEVVGIIMSGTQSQGTSALSTVGRQQKYDEADFTAPLVSLNSLFNDPRAPIIDRPNPMGMTEAEVCASADPAIRETCDLDGFDGFDGRVAIPPPPAVQVAFVTLDNGLTNEQRALLGCGPFWGTRCDSSAIVNNLAGGNPAPRHFARAGGLDFLNMEASALVQAWPGVEGTTDGHPTWARLPTSPSAPAGDVRQQPATVLARYYDRGDNPPPDPNTLFGPVCTRFVPSLNGTVKLPGCRGVKSLDVVTEDDNGTATLDDDVFTVEVEFEEGYLPSVDGCVIGSVVNRPGAPAGADTVTVALSGASANDNRLQAEFPLCNAALRERQVTSFVFRPGEPRFIVDPLDPADPNLVPNLMPNPARSDQVFRCSLGAIFGRGDPGTPTDPGLGNDAGGNPLDPVPPAGGIDFRVCQEPDLVTLAELPMIHPTAGCVDSDVWFVARAENLPAAGNHAVTGRTQLGGCEFFNQRDLVEEFLAGTAALWQNELAAFSWNMLMFLATSSCNKESTDLDGLDHSQPLRQGALGRRLPIGAIGAIRQDPQCFDAERPWSPGRCSFASPQLCSNVKGFFAAAGVRRNVVRAGGNGVHGRRTFIWHGGGELVLTYEQRNVLGFSTDFAEDVTKTNWGVEFTWIEDIPFTDNDSIDGITRSDAFNLTVSVDRPTFINFLNPNRTFFFNSQWFFNYRPDYNNGFTSNGPLNVLFTFAMFTGYFQDRVMPQLVTVYDFNSRSGGVLPSLQYRFTEAFSATIGMLFFFGRTELTDMPINEFGPPSNRTGEKAYEVGVDNALSVIRKRDEVFLRLRWTF